MCGIFAAFANSKHYYEKYEQIAKDLYSRGPDAEGHLNKENIHLIHRRLSIQDLSEAGNQPLKSHHQLGLSTCKRTHFFRFLKLVYRYRRKTTDKLPF